MKALLVKDICLLSQQKKFLGMILLLAVFLNYTGDDTFAVSYLTFLSSFLVLNSISYDEYDNGFCFLFTFPIKRNTYVRSKYVLAITFCLLSWMIGCLISLVCYLVKNQAGQIQGGITESSMLLPLMLIFIAVIIPLVLKFGMEKGKIIMAALFCGCGFFVYLMVSKSQIGIKIIEMFSWLGGQPQWLLMSALVAGTVIILGISYWVSVAVMKGKEF
ncbi:MAG: ABC-2 transporter permease [Lachnospiraceae bacterium]|nr:ABC-2 transporter permease [Lachnospiraceae bacterium]